MALCLRWCKEATSTTTTAVRAGLFSSEFYSFSAASLQAWHACTARTLVSAPHLLNVLCASAACLQHFTESLALLMYSTAASAHSMLSAQSN